MNFRNIKMLSNISINPKKDRIKKSFNIIMSRRHNLRFLWEQERYADYLAILNESIEDLGRLLEQASEFELLEKNILFELSKLKFKRDLVIAKIAVSDNKS